MRCRRIRRERARENFDGVDVLRIHDLGEVGSGGLRNRRAVEFVGQAVKAVRNGFVVRELHDARNGLDDLYRLLLVGSAASGVRVSVVTKTGVPDAPRGR